MNHLSHQDGLDEDIPGIEILLLYNFLAVLDREHLFSRNKNLEHIVSEIGILDSAVKKLLYFGFLTRDGAKHVPCASGSLRTFDRGERLGLVGILFCCFHFQRIVKG